ncbi:MAG: methyltransferase domain-containing protein [Bacteroidales bacterium]
MKDYLENKIDPAANVHVSDELPFWSAPFGIELLEAIEYRNGITALDVGFGTGFPLIELAMRLGEESTVYGIDPWEPAVARTRQKIGILGIKNIRIIQGMAEELPLEDASVDLIVSNNGLNNVSDLDRVLVECGRVIRSGGQFVITVNLDRTMIEFYKEFARVLSDMKMQRELERMQEHIRAKRRPLKEILSKLEANGFSIKDLKKKQFNYHFASGTAMLNHFFIRMDFLDSWVGILPEEKVEMVFEKMEERLNGLACRLGSLQLSVPYVLINARKLQEQIH